MKKILAFLLALTLLSALCACGESNDAAVVKVGILNSTIENEIITRHNVEYHPELMGAGTLPMFEIIHYDNLFSALLALDKGDIDAHQTNKATCDYILAHNDNYVVDPNAPVYQEDDYRFSMMTTDQNKELYEILDGAIRQLKADGTLDRMIEEDLNAYITSDPVPAELPKFDGAKTYKIAVTGDVPPMDFVTADGKAAGFNVALLSEIANIAKVNFELVPVDTGARTIALSSGTVDAVFWMITGRCLYCDELLDEAPEGMLVTDSYFSDSIVFFMCKR